MSSLSLTKATSVSQSGCLWTEHDSVFVCDTLHQESLCLILCYFVYGPLWVQANQSRYHIYSVLFTRTTSNSMETKSLLFCMISLYSLNNIFNYSQSLEKSTAGLQTAQCIKYPHSTKLSSCPDLTAQRKFISAKDMMVHNQPMNWFPCQYYYNASNVMGYPTSSISCRQWLCKKVLCWTGFILLYTVLAIVF